ncbi:monovalent cation/H(+) antiporter subunit G [Methylobacterium sp. J-076]|uniref:monovalent cation/H(+) antiporter subunit G n=1 Tax=Methylobacterium sp. J-076 TaxID=2836655 RepID=UPI001FB9B1F1|nr:monovalent cation/H(+) antiporter subunit G [Methylobacterium sp. J-076]MCJ2013044.1 monovalent cation/H(+) antiporter subunit G [Methylobacterium sp. J-076]
MSTLVGALLALTVGVTWLSALAILRMPRALDRFHATSFLNVATGVCVTAVSFAADGVSDRSLKVLLMMVLLVAFGAVLSHAAGRAVLLREGRSA